MPAWSWPLIYAAGIYAALNFALFNYNSEGGSPDIRDGHYVLHDHGKIIRELSEDEYHIQKAYVARGFSGHWMLFYLMPALYFGFADAALRVEPEPDEARKARSLPWRACLTVGAAIAVAAAAVLILIRASSEQPPAVAVAPTTDAARPIPQKAALYEEDPNDPAGKRYVGSVVWRTEAYPSPGQPAALAVRADIETPQRKISARWSFQRNDDKALPAKSYRRGYVHAVVEFSAWQDYEHS